MLCVVLLHAMPLHVCRNQHLPKAIAALQEIRITLAVGGWRHTMAADDTGQLYGWGWNRVGSASARLCLLVCVRIPGQVKIGQDPIASPHTRSMSAAVLWAYHCMARQQALPGCPSGRRQCARKVQLHQHISGNRSSATLLADPGSCFSLGSWA